MANPYLIKTKNHKSSYKKVLKTARVIRNRGRNVGQINVRVKRASRCFLFYIMNLILAICRLRIPQHDLSSAKKQINLFTRANRSKRKPEDLKVYDLPLCERSEAITLNTALQYVYFVV